MSYKSLLSVLNLASTLFLSGAACCAQTANLLQNGDFTRGKEAWTMTGQPRVQTEFVDASAGTFKRAARLTITPQEGDKPWNASLRQDIAAAIPSGAALNLKFHARSPQSVSIGAFVEETQEPYRKLVDAKANALGPNWKEFSLTGTAKQNYAAGALRLTFHLAGASGVIEIAGVRLESAGATANVPVANVAPLPAAPAVAGASLIQNGDFSAPLEGNWFSGGRLVPTLEIVPAEAGNFKKALRVTVDPPAESRPWDSRLAQKVDVPIKKGDAIYIRAWMRSPQSASVGLFHQMAATPFTKSAERTFKLTPQWTEYKFSGVAKQDFAPGESLFEFHVGQAKATIELAVVRVENYGSTPPVGLEVTPVDYWGGQKHDDAWKTAALERIEKIRKGDLKIRVVDAKGQPIRGATIKLAQTRQQFRWGSAINENRVLDTENPDNVRYRAEIERLYNTVVFEGSMKWGLWKTTDAASEEAKRAQVLPQVEEAIRQLRAKGLDVRGHALVWGRPDHLPHKVLNLDDEALRVAVKDHIFDYSKRFEGQVYVWDVVNETITNNWLWDEIGWENFANAYKWARQADPNVLLAYNDYDITNESKGAGQREQIKKKIQYLLDQGAPLDIIGDQAHMGVPLTPHSRVLEILDEMAKFGKPIEITEFDVVIPDDKLHGEYVRDWLIAAFSHPKVESFVMWGFWEGSHWRAAEGGAMFRRDWSKRPAQQAYEKLVLGDWMTKANLQTDTNGVIQTRGFLGDYQLTISANGQTKTVPLKLPKTGARLQIALE